MTIKELKEQIKDLPDSAEAIFSLWQADDRYHYFIMKKSNNRIVDIEQGGKAVIIANCDNCAADKMVETKRNTFTY